MQHYSAKKHRWESYTRRKSRLFLRKVSNSLRSPVEQLLPHRFLNQSATSCVDGVQLVITVSRCSDMASVWLNDWEVETPAVHIHALQKVKGNACKWHSEERLAVQSFCSSCHSNLSTKKWISFILNCVSDLNGMCNSTSISSSSAPEVAEYLL